MASEATKRLVLRSFHNEQKVGSSHNEQNSKNSWQDKVKKLGTNPNSKISFPPISATGLLGPALVQLDTGDVHPNDPQSWPTASIWTISGSIHTSTLVKT